MHIPTYLQYPTKASASEQAINAAISTEAFAASGYRRALVLQTVQALPVVAIDHTRAPHRPAAYGEGGSSWSAYRITVARSFNSVLHTNSTPGDAVA